MQQKNIWMRWKPIYSSRSGPSYPTLTHIVTFCRWSSLTLALSVKTIHHPPSSSFRLWKNFMSLSTLGKERRRPVPSVHQSLRSFSHLIPICSTSSFCPTSQVPTIPRATTSTLSLTQCWPPFVTNFGIRALILDQMASISSTRAVTPSELAISQTLWG